MPTLPRKQTQLCQMSQRLARNTVLSLDTGTRVDDVHRYADDETCVRVQHEIFFLLANPCTSTITGTTYLQVGKQLKKVREKGPKPRFSYII